VADVAGDDVARARGRAADRAGSALVPDAVAAVRDRRPTGGRGADQVAQDRRPDDLRQPLEDGDPREAVAGDHVAVSGGRPADGVAVAVDHDPPASVAQVGGPVGADVASTHDVVVASEDDAAAGEARDHQPGDRRPRRCRAQDEPVGGARELAVDPDEGRAGCASLRRPVDRDGIGDLVQGARRRDRLHAGAVDGERDGVVPGVGVRVEDRLAQRPCARVVRVRYDEGLGCIDERREREVL
jgi:hypothetical protein